MKRFLSIILSLALMLTLFAACSSAADATEDSSEAEGAVETATAEASLLGEDGVFVVGFDQDFPPYGYVGDDGEFTGFDIECAKVLAERLGWEISLQPIDWDAKDFELESGTIDCIWNGFTINGREDLYEWTQAYVDNSQVFVVRSDSGIASVADLAGKVVAAQKDSSALSAINDDPELLASFEELIEVAEYNTAFMDLEQGAIDAVAMDIGVAEYQMEGREADFTILEETLMAEQYGIGFKLGNTALRDAVEAEFVKMVEEGVVAEISAEFFDGEDVCIIGK
ncbi:MAG: amino acid ABC transporter substrate-binding protein [Oscillospiraceae bacterium]|nr:amino acid ABC transporter substrate-binding protein [Oscillospiraceae bacterium]